MIIAFLHDSRKVSMNTVIKVFTFAFTWGYGVTFMAEIIISTAVRLGIYYIILYLQYYIKLALSGTLSIIKATTEL